MSQAYKVKNDNLRRSFTKIREVMSIPNLIQVQKSSYYDFLMKDIPADQRGDKGLNSVFKSVFPISDYAGNATVEFVKYEFDTPKFDINECRIRGLTYSAPMRITLRLIVFETDETTQVKTIKDIKEQEVFMGDIPFMTPNGTFVINGTERVIVSQVHRSPGVLFEHDKGKTHQSGKILFSAHVVPYRGSWLDFQFDVKDIINCRIDRKRKLLATTFLLALGLSSDEILSSFYDIRVLKRSATGWVTEFLADLYKGQKPSKDVINADTGEVVFEAGKKLTMRVIKQAQEDGLKHISIDDEQLLGMYLGQDYINEKTGEIYLEGGTEITADNLELISHLGYNEIRTLDADNIKKGSYIRNTLVVDKNTNQNQALLEIYRIIRPGEPPTLESAKSLFESLFFDLERYDLSVVGRVKMNMRLELETSDDLRVLTKEDIIALINILHDLRDGHGDIDDIDHLGNRRIRSVGELMENQYRLGLLRMERSIKERLSSADTDTVMPQDLINMKPAVAVVREFFGTSQLSQFMDQTNPLSEITHKRRISALGPGGLSRDRAGFEVRDVHPTHYGRICPIETPEGPNIGLINSLATFSRINKYGFIESPYRKVNNGVVTDDVHYLSAIEEARYAIAQANAVIDDNGKFLSEFIQCRKGGDQFFENPERIDYIDVSPRQIVSVAASLVPFLENDDANRALMGANMQRQAVPLLISEAPLVGTGMEKIVAHDSGAVILAKRSGVVEQVDASRIVIRTDESDYSEAGVDIYRLRKYQRSNQNTCINQISCVQLGDKVRKGDIIADGSSTELGELALGKNVLVAFMPWNGYNYEDSILLSERIVKDDVYTSIHIEEFEVAARDTKLGPEEITRDIPNISEEALRNLDEAGVVYIGAEVKPGDVLVGKITPKGESLMTPEEKLLRAIFGEKASDVRDTSLHVPPGVAGTVVEVRVFNRHGLDKDERAQQIEREEIEKLLQDKNDETKIVDANVRRNLMDLLIGQTVTASPKSEKLEGVLSKQILDNILLRHLWQIGIADQEVMQKIEALNDQYNKIQDDIKRRFEDKVQKLQQGDDLPPGVMKVVKVFVAVKRKIQPGDKMAGRHGNKGVVSKVVPIEDMPFLADGTPADIVLNPLGVPSRMNVGQILETHLGWASSQLGKKIANLVDDYCEKQSEISELRKLLVDIYGQKEFDRVFSDYSDEEFIEVAKRLSRGVPFATPVFDGAREADIKRLLSIAGCDESGQSSLYDGKTGEVFDRQVTVGYIYMLKLHHLVDDKIHARSIGPYSLVTQQPLGGKAQFGGQRLGEMEVWALQAYGAAYTLQEMLTIKSDDVAGRTKVYESIVRGSNDFESGLPESFNVLMKEMRSLGLNVELSAIDKEE